MLINIYSTRIREMSSLSEISPESPNELLRWRSSSVFFRWEREDLQVFKALNMRNAIKHERCNADAHADFNNKTTRLLHLHFSFKTGCALNTSEMKEGLKYSLSIAVFHVCISTKSFFSTLVWEMNESSHCMWCICSTALLTNTSILFTITANSWKSEAFTIIKGICDLLSVLFHARHRHLEQNTIGCLSKAVQPRNLSVVVADWTGSCKVPKFKSETVSKQKSSKTNKKQLYCVATCERNMLTPDYCTGGG